MAAIRYRSGIDEANGSLLSGQAHLAQSLRKIWRTVPGQRWRLLDYGSDIRSRLGEDVTAALALTIYNDLVTAAARWEPEYALTALQLVLVNESGKLGLRHSGIYYPEGRYGNYDLAIPLEMVDRRLGASS